MSNKIKIDADTVRKVAKISKLEIKEDEIEKYVTDLSSILDAFAILDEADVEGISSSFRPVDESENAREDTPVAPIENKEALKFTDNKENGFFIGPRTIE